MDIVEKRNFKVKGQLNCIFEPGTTPITKQVQGIEIELWQKSPLEIIYLGKGVTDANGDFVVEFDLDSPNTMIKDGKIEHVFVKAYYNGVLVTGDNPY